MNRERITLPGVLAIAALLFATGFIVAFAERVGATNFLKSAWPKPKQVQQEPVDGYLVQQTLQNASSTKEVLGQQLLSAFVSGHLFKAGTWDVPGRDGTTLVVASPTTDGKAQPLECGFMLHVYCGLYLVTPTYTSLLAWGDELTGFGGVLTFLDADHPVLGFAWQFMNYMNVEQRIIDLGTGIGSTRVLLELDQDDVSSVLYATGTWSGLRMQLDGSNDKGRMIPSSLIVTRGDYELFRMTSEEIASLALAARTAEHPLKPVTLYDFALDVTESKELLFNLFQLPYAFNVETGGLQRVTTP